MARQFATIDLPGDTTALTTTTATTTIEALEAEEVDPAARSKTTEDAMHATTSHKTKSTELDNAAQLAATSRKIHNHTTKLARVEHYASPATFARPQCLKASSSQQPLQNMTDSKNRKAGWKTT